MHAHTRARQGLLLLEEEEEMVGEWEWRLVQGLCIQGITTCGVTIEENTARTL